MHSASSFMQEPHPIETASSRADAGTLHRHVRRGPNNEVFLPHVVPEEAWRAPHKFGIPLSWIEKVDSTPDRSMPLGNDSWVSEHGNWLRANAQILNLPAASHLQGFGDARDALNPIEGDWDFRTIVVADHCECQARDSESDEGGNLCGNHNTTASVRGQDRGMWWTLEALKRDPDEFGMHIFKGFSSYGGMEVLENLFSHFSKTCRRTSQCLDIWCEVEGLALYLKNDVGDFIASDDTERASHIVALLGALTVAALGVLDKEGLLRPDGDIPNIGFILSILVERGWELGASFAAKAQCTSWVYRVLDMATNAGITMFGGNRFQSAMHEIKENESAGRTPGFTRKWSVVNFTQRFQSYRRKHQLRLPSHIPFRGIVISLGIGGASFDITRLPFEERRNFFVGRRSSFDAFDSTSSESEY